MRHNLKLAIGEYFGTQLKCAEKTGIHHTRLNRIVRGWLEPSPAERDHLASVLGTDPEWLFSTVTRIPTHAGINAAANLAAQIGKQRIREEALREAMEKRLNVAGEDPVPRVWRKDVSLAPQNKKPKRRVGRPKLRAEDRAGFRLARMVEAALKHSEHIFSVIRSMPKADRVDANKVRSAVLELGYSDNWVSATLRSDRPLVAARWFISLATRRSYGGVANYHKLYRPHGIGNAGRKVMSTIKRLLKILARSAESWDTTTAICVQQKRGHDDRQRETGESYTVS